MYKSSAAAAVLAAITVSISAEPAEAIGHRDFFERLDQALKQTFTFQADVIQESIYPDGIVQRYSGKLAVSEEGRISYGYDLVGEYEDPSLAKTGYGQTLPTGDIPAPQHPTRQEGRYITKGDKVMHYDPDQHLIVESAEQENLLIQLFRNLVGAGDFDMEPFLDNHKIERIQETEFEGIPVYLMVAQPKKGSDLYRSWTEGTSNERVEWRQELWVKQSNMEPVKAVLTMHNESTSILLSNVRINAKVDASPFQIDFGGKGMPRTIRGQSFPPPVQPEMERLPPVERPLQEIQIEE
jgi:outer membrane lipoprotein-sorting protein